MELINAGTDKLRGIIDTEKRTFAFVVNITSFEGFNAELQRDHFNENYMESDKYPTASFKGRIIEETDFNKNGNYVVRAKGILNIHGVEQERIIKANVGVKDNYMTVESKFPVVLSDHGITVPKVVHEKIASEITVEIKAELNKK
jgi:polyisoprenoid-binding protein YceI